MVTLLCVLSIYLTAQAQSTSFTYQGRLADSGTPTNGNYDLQFSLWNSLSGGGQVGSTQTNNSVAVSNGVFTVNLDFGAGAFPGASRFLEIAVRPAGVGSFITLTPRQPITSTPYAVRSLNAATADNVPASGVAAGSVNYIQNSANPQAATNFNISGTGTASVLSASQFNLNGSPVLSGNGANNIFVGSDAGTAITTGRENTFVGAVSAGSSNTTGGGNSFFGYSAGRSNTTGQNNSFFGDQAGGGNTAGSNNTLIGAGSGFGNQGDFNTVVGVLGQGNFTNLGNNSSFFGEGAGLGLHTGSFLTLLGSEANAATPVSNSTAIGFRAFVTTSNAIVLGSINGTNGATADTNVGIGTTAPQRKLNIKGVGADGFGVGDLLVTGTGTVGSSITLEATGSGGRKFSWLSTASDADAGGGTLSAFDGTAGAYRIVINSAGNIGIGTTAPTATLSVNGGANKPGGGSWGSFSDERLKTIRGSFTSGLQAVMRLQPLRYEYKPDNALKLKSQGEHIGFSAQSVQKVIPEAVSQTDNGYLVVNNDPILWTMLNAIKEQQKEIEQLKKTVARLQRRRGRH